MRELAVELKQLRMHGKRATEALLTASASTLSRLGW